LRAFAATTVFATTATPFTAGTTLAWELLGHFQNLFFRDRVIPVRIGSSKHAVHAFWHFFLADLSVAIFVEVHQAIDHLFGGCSGASLSLSTTTTLAATATFTTLSAGAAGTSGATLTTTLTATAAFSTGTAWAALTTTLTATATITAGATLATMATIGHEFLAAQFAIAVFIQSLQCLLCACDFIG
jgi:hypothetical protein